MSPTERRRGPQYCDEHQRGDDELLRQVLARILPAPGRRVAGQDGLHSGERRGEFVEIKFNLKDLALPAKIIETYNIQFLHLPLLRHHDHQFQLRHPLPVEVDCPKTCNIPHPSL